MHISLWTWGCNAGVVLGHWQEIEACLKENVLALPPNDPARSVEIVIDAVHGQAGLMFDSGTGELVGFGDVEDTYLSGGQAVLADQVMTFFVRNLYGKPWSCAVAFYSFKHQSTDRLRSHLLDVSFLTLAPPLYPGDIGGKAQFMYYCVKGAQRSRWLLQENTV